MLDIKTVKLRSEKEIISSWSDKENIRVSIICTTYNHESYIQDSITGFLMQRTDFAFEIIIHDDASTDATPSLVREYQEQYPHIIKPIFQTENQYSKGAFKPGIYAASFAKGEFIAWCEGDDYWSSDNKLMKQFEIMNKNHDINMCAHAHFVLSENLKLIPSVICSKSPAVLPPENFIIGDGDYVATCSLFIRKPFLCNLPDWFFNKAPVGDYYLQILSSYPNGALYLNEPMCVYRRYAANNWSSQTLRNCNSRITLRRGILETNLLCEKELNDFKLFKAFTIANYHHFKLCMAAKYRISSKMDFIKLFIDLFQFRFIFYPVFRVDQKLYEIFQKDTG